MALVAAGGTLAASTAFADAGGANDRVTSTAATRIRVSSEMQALPPAPAAIAPYCTNTYTNNVEPITLVKINDINNPSVNTTGGTAHQDFTSVIGTLRPGATYAVTMKSNTDGATFTHGHVLYVDWNQDGLLTGADEGYWIGTITGSDGVDAKEVTAFITVPATATLGNTRLRAMTLYDAAALADIPPCRTGTGYGQSEDYTVTVDMGAAVPPLPLTVSGGFTPAAAPVPATTTLAIQIGNINTDPSPLTADFTTTLPAGMTLAANASTTCPGTLTGSTGGSAITLASGAAIPVGGCSISADVAVPAAGNYDVAIGPATTAEGNASGGATFFGYGTVGSNAYSTGFEAPYTAGTINGQQGWQARTSNVATTAPFTGTQHFSQTALASPTTSNNPLAISPEFPAGTTRYVAVSADLRISRTTNGASWYFQPQDPDAEMLTTYVRFNRTGNSIDTILWSGGSGTFTPTGATFTADTYFNLKLLVDRATSNVRICKDGVQIYETTSGNGTTGGNNVTNMVFQQVTGSGQTANNTFFADNLDITYTPSYNCDGSLPQYTVTSSVGTPSGSISPLGAQSVNEGDSIAFTLTPDSGFHVDTVGGTCVGSLVGNTYTVSGVMADCTVVANFAADTVTHTVTAVVGTGSGSITPPSAVVNDGATTAFTVTPASGFHIDAVTGCGGSLAANTYTTGAITADCTVTANFAPDGAGGPLLTIDLTSENQITISTAGGSAVASASGGTSTGFYFAGFFANAGTQAVSGHTLSGTATLTAASVAPDGTPDLFRAGAGADTGLNVWSYSSASTTTFTAGQVAFAGTATWNVSPAIYAAMLTAPTGGDVYFPADDVGDLATATLLGTYQVILPVSGTPVASVTPTSLSFTVDEGDSASDVLTIANTGGGTLNWTLVEAPAKSPTDAGKGTVANTNVAATSGRGVMSPTGDAPRANPAPMAVVINEGFDDFASLISGGGWITANHSSPLGASTWAQCGGSAIPPAFDGGTNSCALVNFNSATGAGTISNWLLTPEVSFGPGSTASFYTRTGGVAFPDRLEVRLCTSGPCTNFGSGANDVGDFTTVLLTVNPNLVPADDPTGANGYPAAWSQFTIPSSSLPSSGTGRIAFRYFVTNGGPDGSNSNIIGLDRVVVDNGGGGGPTGCASPSDVPWLSASATSGAVAGGAADTPSITVDASSLTAGTYSAHVCVATNDPGNALVDVPVSVTVTGGSSSNDLLVIDLTSPNQVTISATNGTSLASASGSTTTGFYFQNFFANAGTQAIGTATVVGTATLTAASVAPDGTPSMFRTGDNDPGLNIWSYSSASTTTFTAGQVAFAGTATWSITPALYNAMLTAPTSGSVFFPADDVGDLGGATQLGTYTVILPGAGNPPSASVTPASLSFTVQENLTGSQVLNIANAVGSEPLTFSITGQASRQARLMPYMGKSRDSGVLRSTGTKLFSSGRAGSRTAAPWAPVGPDGTVTFQADDGTYENGISWSDGTTQNTALWLNRYTATGALTIDTVSIEWPDLLSADGDVTGRTVNLVAYYDADGDGDPSDAVRLGSNTPVTINGPDVFENYPTNFVVPGAGDVYLGFVDTFAAGGTSPILYAAAVDEDGNPNVGWAAAMSVGDADVDVLGNNDNIGTLAGLSGGQLSGVWMVRGTASGGGGGTCTGGAVSWLSASPASGSVPGGSNTNVTVTANPSAGGLTPGSYSAVLCITTNDPNQALITVPVSLTVTAGPVVPCSAADTIFCDGFELPGGGPFTQPIEDPSFEATTDDGDVNPFWDGSDSNSLGGTPFYSTAQGQARTGQFAAWGGGWRSPGVQEWSQSVTIASGGPRWLNYWRFVALAPNGTATLVVSVDGTPVATTNIVANGVDADWTNVSVDLSAYADNGTHLVKFTYTANGSEDGNCFVDDITIDDHQGSN